MVVKISRTLSSIEDRSPICRASRMKALHTSSARSLSSHVFRRELSSESIVWFDERYDVRAAAVGRFVSHCLRMALFFAHSLRAST